MLKAYKYRLYPTKAQEILLNKHFGACRFVYNLALSLKQQVFSEYNKNLSTYNLINQLPELKKECPWLKEIGSNSLQQSIINLDKAYNSFFNKTSSFPKFKKKNSSQSFRIPSGIDIKIIKNKIYVPKFRGGINIILDKRAIEGIIKSATVSKTSTNKYYISILVDTLQKAPELSHISLDTTIGIDVGIKTFVTCSNNLTFENNRFLKHSLKRLGILQKRASKKKKGSNNRKKANLKVALLHERITNQRKDYLHKITSILTKENQFSAICIEDLNVKGMLANHNLAQSISDVSFGKFYEFLEYKCRWKGINLIKIDRFAPSSKMCNNCFVLNYSLTLGDRDWKCNNCGNTQDRDLGAAINIRNIAINGIINQGKYSPQSLWSCQQ